LRSARCARTRDMGGTRRRSNRSQPCDGGVEGQFGTHSARIGGTTTASMTGAYDKLVRTHGRRKHGNTAGDVYAREVQAIVLVCAHEGVLALLSIHGRMSVMHGRRGRQATLRSQALEKPICIYFITSKFLKRGETRVTEKTICHFCCHRLLAVSCSNSVTAIAEIRSFLYNRR
jgi:hypothetical protein